METILGFVVSITAIYVVSATLFFTLLGLYTVYLFVCDGKDNGLKFLNEMGNSRLLLFLFCLYIMAIIITLTILNVL